jgi:hypothetical protein
VTVTTTSSASRVAAPAPRTLQHFEPLSLAEVIVLHAAAAGEIAKVSFRRPRQPNLDVRVRAEFLSFLIRSGELHVAGRNLQIMGACVVGRIDLTDATVPMSLWLFRCLLGGPPRLEGAHINGNVTFGDCSMPSLLAQGCRVDGDFSLNAGCSIDGDVILAHARIGKNLDCDRMHLRGSADEPSRLVADGAQIGGNVNLSGGFEAVGGVRFVAANIAGDLRASNARMTADIDASGARGVSLDMDRLRVGGSVFLDNGFSAAGQVRFQQAVIEGDLNCAGAAFDVVGDASWGDNSAALLLDRASVGGSLILRQLQGPLQGASLIDARVGMLVDDASTWGQNHMLDGFAYTRLAGDAPADAQMRVEWLSRQHSVHLGEDFRPDPWRRLIKVLHRMGRDPSARDVAVEREKHLRRAGLIGLGSPAPLRWITRAGHDLYGALAGYGHRPLRVLSASVVLWLACAGVYWAASEEGIFAPAAPLELADPALASCRPDCAALPPTVPEFRPFIYSLDVIMPLVDLRQERYWAPARRDQAQDFEVWLGASPIWLLIWFEGLCGWLASLTLLALITGFVDRRR